jgi:putative membrane protein
MLKQVWKNRGMRFIIRVVVLAVALWLTTLIVGGPGDNGVWIVPFEDSTWGFIGTLLVVALVFGVVNSIIGPFIRIVSIPLYVLTLGLFGLIINGLLLMLTAWLTQLLGFGLIVDGFWWGVLAALVLSFITAILSAILRAGFDD